MLDVVAKAVLAPGLRVAVARAMGVRTAASVAKGLLVTKGPEKAEVRENGRPAMRVGDHLFLTSVHILMMTAPIPMA